MKLKILSATAMSFALLGVAHGQLDTAANVSGVSLGAIYNPGQVRALSWRVLVPHPGSIELSFSVNGSVWTPVVSLPANTTSYNWTVPATLTFHGLIRVYQLRTDTTPAPPPSNTTTLYSLRSAQFTIAYPISIWGSVTAAGGTGGPTPISGAKVVLVSPAGVRIDSTLTTAGGSYNMSVNVPTGAGYTLIVSASGYTTVTRNGVTLDANPNLNGNNFTLTPSVGILEAAPGSAPRTHRLGDKLAVEFGRPNSVSAVEIFGADGILRIRIPVAPGTARVLLPADLAPRGSLLRTR